MQFLLRYTPRTLRSRFILRKAQQKKATARFENRRQPLDVAAAVPIAEDVEQATVDHVVEPLGPIFERQSVFDEKHDLQTSLRSFALRPLDRHFEKVNARDLAS